jgi:hypothetical protein
MLGRAIRDAEGMKVETKLAAKARIRELKNSIKMLVELRDSWSAPSRDV